MIWSSQQHASDEPEVACFRRTSCFSEKIRDVCILPSPEMYGGGVLRSTSYNSTKLLVLRSTAVACVYAFAVCVSSPVRVRSTVCARSTVVVCVRITVSHY